VITIMLAGMLMQVLKETGAVPIAATIMTGSVMRRCIVPAKSVRIKRLCCGWHVLLTKTIALQLKNLLCW